MPISDLPLAELEIFRPETRLPCDFDEFWRRTLAESRAQWQVLNLVRVDFGISAFEVHDVTFSGFHGEKIKGWYFYCRLYADAVLAIDAVKSLNIVDPEKTAVTGSSQGDDRYHLPTLNGLCSEERLCRRNQNRSLRV